MSIVNQNEIRFYGIQRSGNHAVISWIFQGFPGTVVHLNNVTDIDPFTSFSEMLVKGIDFWKCKPKISSFIKTILTRQSEFEFVISDPKVRVNFIRKYSPKDCLIVSYENYSLNKKTFQIYDHNHDQYVGSSKNIINVVILRDPYNLFASLMKSGYAKTSDFPKMIRLFKEYARVFLGEVPKSSVPLVCINYNKWCVDSEYRKDIASKIGFYSSGNPFLKVQKTGGGSSFTGLKANRKPTEIKKVLERYKYYFNDNAYKSIFKDNELQDLSNSIFGKIVEM